MISKLKPLLKSGDYQFEEQNDVYVLTTTASHIDPLFSILQHEASFIAAVAVPGQLDSSLKLRYIFYPQIPSKLLIIDIVTEAVSPSMTAYFPILALYEQEITKQHGISFINSHSLVTPQHSPPEFLHQPDLADATIIPVGPIHAGVIEPGHFRFTAFGEHIVSLQIKLGYKHRGVTEAFTAAPIAQAIELAEHICGDSVIAYALALVQAAEKIQGIVPCQRTLLLRSLLQELERLYNHVGDVAMLINDTGFANGFARLIVLKEQLLRLNQELFGHRFLKANIALHGLVKLPEPKQLQYLQEKLNLIYAEFARMVAMIRSNHGVLERFKNTGILSNGVAKSLSVSGLVGRASAVSFDVRRDFSYAAYGDLDFEVHGRKTGDVLARYNVRLSEITESFQLVGQCITKLIESADTAQAREAINKAGWACSMAESARGPVFCYLELAANGIIKQCIIRDISLHNWRALEHAVLHNIVADFPVCNKSFSLAYAGTDM